MQASSDADLGQIEIMPLTLVTRTFPTRPSALPDIRDFVRRRLNQTTLSDDEVRTLCDRVAAVLLDAAGVFGTIQVSLRIFPRYAEVDVLVAAEGAEGEEGGRASGIGVAPPSANRRSVAPVSPAMAPVSPAAALTPPPAAIASGDTPVPVSFADWLAGSLRREGMTLEAAARRLGVSVKTVSRWVGGSTEPRLRDLSRIRETFGEFPFL